MFSIRGVLNEFWKILVKFVIRDVSNLVWNSLVQSNYRFVS